MVVQVKLHHHHLRIPAVVILAVILDRLTQSLANPPALSPAQRWGEWLRLWRA